MRGLLVVVVAAGLLAGCSNVVIGCGGRIKGAATLYGDLDMEVVCPPFSALPMTLAPVSATCP